MNTLYFESRKTISKGVENLTADAVRHLYTRQPLGKAVVIVERPESLIATARKTWLKLARALQKQRSSTINADKILKYTRAVTRMQRMSFSSKTPQERPDVDVYFLRPDQTDSLSLHCLSFYTLCETPLEVALAAIHQLPDSALIVDYTASPVWNDLGLQPKKELEEKVSWQWRRAERFLKQNNINIHRLIVDDIHDIEAIDDALDTLLGGLSHEFLGLANDFKRALELARPMRLDKNRRNSYDTLVLLAHRVEALTPGAFSQHFLETYNEDDGFLLYDPALKHLFAGGESLAEATRRHTKAGRQHLARSLRLLAETKR
jgi:hypothetical protein